MTKAEFKYIHRRLRKAGALRYHWARELLGCFLGGQMGGYWYTSYHPNGHLHSRASHANVLQHAAGSRFQPDHAVYMERCRLLRTKGTWL